MNFQSCINIVFFFVEKVINIVYLPAFIVELIQRLKNFSSFLYKRSFFNFGKVFVVEKTTKTT